MEGDFGIVSVGTKSIGPISSPAPDNRISSSPKDKQHKSKTIFLDEEEDGGEVPVSHRENATNLKVRTNENESSGSGADKFGERLNAFNKNKGKQRAVTF